MSEVGILLFYSRKRKNFHRRRKGFQSRLHGYRCGNSGSCYKIRANLAGLSGQYTTKPARFDSLYVDKTCQVSYNLKQFRLRPILIQCLMQPIHSRMVAYIMGGMDIKFNSSVFQNFSYGNDGQPHGSYKG